MTVTPEEVAAYADGELDPVRAAEVAAAVAADPTLREQVQAHRALRAKLEAHFASILEAPLPTRLTGPLRPYEGRDLMPSSEAPAARGPSLRWGAVVDFAAARERRERPRALPRWSWIAGPALAASLALAVFLPRGGHLEGPLAEALDGQLAATQAADADPRILLSFRDGAGDYCRAFSGSARAGIACHDASGWQLVEDLPGSASGPGGEYRQAGSAEELMAKVQDMAAGPALDAEQERAAQASGWR